MTTTNNEYVNTWINYGDMNPIAWGGMWLEQDTDNETAYNIVKLTNLDSACGEPGFLIDTAYIDIEDFSDSDINDVLSFIGEDEDTSPEQIAIGILDYYGSYHLGGTSEEYATEEAAIEELESHGITIDIEEE